MTINPTPIQTETPEAFRQVLRPPEWNENLNLNASNAPNGLAQLVLTLIQLLHDLLERQALQRMDAGQLTDAQIEEVGTTLMRQAEEIERLCELCGLTPADLNLDLGPLGSLR
jgi:uncharacterized protein YjiS (DUF1127 family)